jgi:predicted transcriptional regulator
MKILHERTECETVCRETFCGGCGLCDANGDAQNTRGWKKGGRYGMTAEMLVNERGKFVKEREMQNASARRTRSREEIEFRFRLGLDGAKMI